MPCPICRESSTSAPIEVPRAKGPDRQWIRCSACMLLYVRDYTPPAYRELPLSRYTFGRGHAQIAGFQYHLGLVHRHLLPPGRYLDVGTGPGCAAHNAWCNGWQAMGMEPWDELAAWGEKHLQIEIARELPDGEGSFDVITSTDVIEHVPDTLSFLQKLFELQAPGGLLFLTSPNGECVPARERPREWGSLTNGWHCVLFGMAGLCRALERVGWIVAEWFEACGPHDDEMLHVIARKPGTSRAREVPLSWLKRLSAERDPRRAVQLHEYVRLAAQTAEPRSGAQQTAGLDRRVGELERRLDAGRLSMRELSLHDDGGRVRAILGPTEDGSFQLRFLDDAQRTRCHVGLLEDGSPLLALADDRGSARIGMILDSDGAPSLGLYDGSSRVRTLLTLQPDDSPEICLLDENGVARDRTRSGPHEGARTS